MSKESIEFKDPIGIHSFVKDRATEMNDLLIEKCKLLHPAYQVLIANRILLLMFQWHFGMIFTKAQEMIAKQEPAQEKRTP